MYSGCREQHGCDDLTKLCSATAPSFDLVTSKRSRIVHVDLKMAQHFADFLCIAPRESSTKQCQKRYVYKKNPVRYNNNTADKRVDKRQVQSKGKLQSCTNVFNEYCGTGSLWPRRIIRAYREPSSTS